MCFFLWLLKVSHPQIQTSRWLPETLWNQQAACVGHIILVSWPLDSHIDFYFIWFWSKAIGEDFKVTSDLWTSMMAFWGILSKGGDKGRNGHSLAIQWKKKNIMTSFVVSVEAAEVSCWGCTEKRLYCWREKCFEKRAAMASPPFVDRTQPQLMTTSALTLCSCKIATPRNPKSYLLLAECLNFCFFPLKECRNLMFDMKLGLRECQ